MEQLIDLVTDPKIWVILSGLAGQYFQLRHKFLKNIMASIHSIKKDVANLKKDRTYENKLFEKITQTTIELVESNVYIDKELTKLLKYTRNKIRNFIIDHWDSSYRSEEEREEEKDIRKYLISESNDIKSQVRDYALTLFPEKRIYDNTPIDYDTFYYKETNGAYLIRDFLTALEKNGLNEDKYMKKSITFIKELHLSQIKCLQSWKNLQQYNQS